MTKNNYPTEGNFHLCDRDGEATKTLQRDGGNCDFREDTGAMESSRSQWKGKIGNLSRRNMPLYSLFIRV